MVDDDKLFGGDDETELEIPEEEDGPEIDDDEEEEGETDDLDPKHLNSLGFGIEDEDF